MFTLTGVVGLFSVRRFKLLTVIRFLIKLNNERLFVMTKYNMSLESTKKTVQVVENRNS